MGAPKTLAQAGRKLLWLPGLGSLANFHTPKVSELAVAGALELSCLVTKANYNLGSTGDNAITDPAACAQGDSSVPGNTTYEAGFDFFRRIENGVGTADPAADKAWKTFTGKGLEGFLIERIGPLGSYSNPFVAAQEVRVYGVITMTPRMLQLPTDGGFEKFRQEFATQTEYVDERAVVSA